MATFEGIQHIGEKVFSFLSVEENLNCRLVCESWKIIMENPLFWLHKLENIGQPKNISKKWLQLIEKAKESGISEPKIVNLMILKYRKFMTPCHKRLGINFFHGHEIKYEIKIDFPPIYQALYCKPEDLEVLKLLMDIDRRSFILPIKCSENFYMTPLVEAINMNANIDVIKCLTSKISNPFSNRLNGGTVLHLAIIKSDFEVCKFFVEKAPKHVFKHLETWSWDSVDSPFQFAFSRDNFEIIKCLALKSPIEEVKLTLKRALSDYRESRVPEESKKHLLEKINFVGSLFPDLKLSLTYRGCLTFPLTDSDFHEINQPFKPLICFH